MDLRGCGPVADPAARPGAACSALTLLDAGLLGFGPFDLAACGQPLVAQYAKSFDLGPLAAPAAVFQDLEIPGSGHPVFIDCLFPGGLGAPEHQQLADVLDGGGIELGCQFLVEGLALDPVVGKYAHLDQAMGFKRGVGFLADGRRQAVAADHDHRVKVVGFGAVDLALDGCELNLRHGPIIEP